MPASTDGRTPKAKCAFCAIIRGETIATTITETEHLLAFLDHRPLFPGHTLLIPRTHYETLTDLPAAESGPLFERTRLLCAAVQEATGAQGTFVAVNNRISQSVPHLHVHIVPRREKDGLKGFFWPRTKYQNEEEIRKIQTAIQTAIERLR